MKLYQTKNSFCKHCDGTGIEPFETSAYPPEPCYWCSVQRGLGYVRIVKQPVPRPSPGVVFWCIVAAGILALMLLANILSGQELPETPKPKSNRVEKCLIFAHGASVAYDLATTREVVREGYVEKDPLTRPLIGERPGVGRMAAFGSLEVAGAALLAKRNPKLGKWVQVAAIVAHVACASHNLTLGGRK